MSRVAYLDHDRLYLHFRGLGMSESQAFNAAERVAIQVEAGMPEAHAIVHLEAVWAGRDG
jgi:hypothetical protein